MKKQKYKNYRRKSDPKSVIYEKVETDSRWQPEDDLKLKTAIEQVNSFLGSYYIFGVLLCTRNKKPW